jgi:predicted O-methyltransferase YrrM
MEFPPGHYHSPFPCLSEIKRNEQRIFGEVGNALPGINLNEEGQLELLEKFAEYYSELPFGPNRTHDLRYFYENRFYSYSDGIVLYCMIRYLRPKRILEVGSGYSSCVILDSNEHFFRGTIECSFVEPYPERLLELVKKADMGKIRVVSKQAQDVDLDEFKRLTGGDILFIDSTHVSKVGSDVNYLIHEVLPNLQDGVHVHFHDILYPFEYPKQWVYGGRAWNEAYVLRAFLQYNNRFEIVLFNTFMTRFHEDWFKKNMPLCLKNPGGSIWIRKGRAKN